MAFVVLMATRDSLRVQVDMMQVWRERARGVEVQMQVVLVGWHSVWVERVEVKHVVWTMLVFNYLFSRLDFNGLLSRNACVSGMGMLRSKDVVTALGHDTKTCGSAMSTVRQRRLI
jgi:hypothetical protein